MTNLRHLFTFACFLLLSAVLQAQTSDPQELFATERVAVLATINQLFDGMRAGDSTQVRATFTPDATMQSISVDKEGNSKLGNGSLDRFVAAVGTPHEEMWDERIDSYEIKIDGALATAWTKYRFFRGDNFSHCGYNAFHLFKSAEGWKIFHIADTRRVENCEE